MSDFPQPKSTAVAEQLEHVSCLKPCLDTAPRLTSIIQRLEKAPIVDIKVITGSDAYTEALIKEPPEILNATTIRLIGCLLLGCFCQTMNGFDGTLFNGLLTNTNFLNFFVCLRRNLCFLSKCADMLLLNL